MAASSGSLGGDDSSKLDALAKSIAENSEKLEILNRILSKTEDAGGTSKKKEGESTTDFLKGVEKLLSKQDIEAARSKSKQLQVDADRLASNTFRASETVISEVLSRLGGTSFYPALSAFRVARESVATATGTPQSELKVGDIIQFVNDSTSELLTNIFTKFKFSVNDVEKPVEDLNTVLQRTKQDLIDIREALMPVTTGMQKELEQVMNLDPSSEEFNRLTLDEIEKYGQYILALQDAGQATQEHINLLNKLDASYKETGTSLRSIINQESKSKLVENIKREQESFTKESPQLQQKINEERDSQSEIQLEAIKSAKTVAGIAGALIPTGFALNDIKNLTGSIQNLASTLVDSLTSIINNPNGGNELQGAANIVSAGSNVAGNVSSLVGTTVGSLINPLIGGPIGSFVGKAISDTVLAPINFAVSTLVSINSSVSQIADDLVGFSPEVTGAIVGREIAILQDDFRRAAQIGPELARITEAQTRLQLATRQAFDNFLEQTEPILVDILNAVTAITEKFPNILIALSASLAPLVPGIVDIVAKLVSVGNSVDDIAKKLGTGDPLELESLAYQSGINFFNNNPAAMVKLK